jgi:nucleotide-binding universal stress UspA family protein
MKNIIVTIKDFETATLTSPIVNKTIDLAKTYSSKVHVLHVVPSKSQAPYNVDRELFRRGVAEELRHEHSCLQKLAKAIRDDGVDARALLAKGSIIDTILHESERLTADLIILGRHKHGPLYKVLMDSTDEGLLAKCSCPIMFVPI